MASLETMLQDAVVQYFKTEMPEQIQAIQEKKSAEIPEMVTVKEVKTRTGLAENFIRYKLIGEGRVKYIRLGTKRILVNWQSVLEYLNSGDCA